MIIYINSIFLYVCDCMYHTPLNENLITVRWSLQVKKPSKHKNQTRCGFFFSGAGGYKLAVRATAASVFETRAASQLCACSPFLSPSGASTH